jgi:hypothetical protein
LLVALALLAEARTANGADAVARAAPDLVSDIRSPVGASVPVVASDIRGPVGASVPVVTSDIRSPVGRHVAAVLGGATLAAAGAGIGFALLSQNAASRIELDVHPADETARLMTTRTTFAWSSIGAYAASAAFLVASTSLFLWSTQPAPGAVQPSEVQPIAAVGPSGVHVGLTGRF